MPITLAVDDGIAQLTIDDGRVNAMDTAFFAELQAGLDGAAEARAVVIAGRPGVFSAGLDTKLLAELDTEEMTDLLVVFGQAMLRVWEEPRPVVAAVTGHAVAGGTVLAMACDHAVAAAGDSRWGLTETSIGFPMPGWIIAIARGNVRADRLDDLVLSGRLVDSAEAVDVGFADETAPADAVVDVARGRAARLAELPANAYGYTKAMLRGASVRAAREALRTDVAAAMAAR